MKKSKVVLLLLACFALMSATTLGQITTSATFPTTGANVTGIGSVAWTNPGRIVANDDSYATAAITSSAGSNYSQGSGFGFAIPADATINGLLVTIGRKTSSGTTIYDNTVQLVKAGTIVGENKASTTAWGSSESAATYGGAADLWGTTWTPTDINTSTFGVALSAKNTSSTSRTASVDYITVAVTYTLAPAYFRSATSGNWGSTATWQQSSDNSTWAPATRTPTNSDYDITILNGHTVTVAAAVSADQTIIESGGQITVSSGITLTLANGTGTDLSVNGTLLITGTLTAASSASINVNSGGLVNVTGTYTTSSGSTIVNDGGIIRNSGTVTGSASTLTFASGGKYQHNYATSNGTIPTATWSDGSTCEIIGYTVASGGTVPTPSGLSQSFYNFVYNCNHAGTVSASNDLATVRGDLRILSTGTGIFYLARSTAGTVNISGNLLISGGNLGLINAGTGNIVNVAGNVTISGDSLVMSSGAGTTTLNVGGNFTHTGGVISETNSGSGTIVFNGTGTQTYTSGGTVSNTINFTVNSGAILDMGTSVITGGGAFTLSSGATLGIGSAAGITSSGAMGNIQSTGTRTFNTAANYVYDGSVSQVTGSGLPATINSLTFNNSSGVTLSGTTTVSGALALTSGVVTGGAYTLTVGSAGSISGGSSTAYVNGSLARIFNATGSKTFPIGKGGNYRPLTLNYTALTGTSTVTANQIEGTLSGTPPGSTTLFADRYWTVTQSGGSAFTYDITLDGTGFSPSGTPVVLKEDAGTVTSYMATAPNYTASGLTSMSNFALGDFLATTLPAAPTVLTAYGISQTHAELTFIDNADNEAHFGIERSTDGGSTFALVASLSAQSGSGSTVTYDDAGLTASTNYCYRAYAFNNVGNSDYSNIACCTTLEPPAQRTLTLNVVGTGCSVTKTPDQATYNDGTVVTLTAIPADGWSFYSWSGDLSSSTSPIAITMSGDKNVTATFEELQVSWTAYNDVVYSSSDTYIGTNVTRYGYTGTTTGLLRKKSDSSSTGVTVTIATSGSTSYQNSNGADANSGTDSYETFYGIASQVGVLNYGSSTAWYADLTFTGLDTAKTYTFATTANRANSSYTSRLSAFIIGGATSYTNTSTSGVTISGDTVRFSTGYNTVNGYVARWEDIKSGSDGSFSVRARTGGTGSDYYGYGPSVFMLQEVTSPPAPVAPTGLTATAAATGVVINLSWTDNSTTEKNFKIQRSTDGGSSYTALATVGVNVTTYSDSGLSAGATYYYRVYAVNGGGSSDYSNSAHATISESPNAPTLVAPANGATGVSTSPSLQATVTDPEADPLTVSFYGRTKAGDGEDFSLVILPDLQNMSQYYPAVELSMTQWVVDNQTANNIVFVTSVGDIVNTSTSATQYAAADAAFDLLDPAGVPYSVGPGNHDMGSSSLYETYFGVSRFTGKSWYGGHYGADNMNNFSLFSASGNDFIVINLQYSPTTAILNWADSLLKAYSGRRGIVEEHDILNIDNSWANQVAYTALKDNPNLFLMLCGHMHSSSDGAAYRAESGDDGHTIHIVMADYQDFASGGNGFLRILRFSPVNDLIYMTTYSPYTGGNITTDPDQKNLVYDLEGAGPYALLGTSNVASGATASYSWSPLTESTEYQWYVAVSDGHTTTTGTTWGFTTSAGAVALADTIAITAANTNYAGAHSGATLNFSTLPVGGGAVIVTRYNSVPSSATYGTAPAGSTYLPVWLNIVSTIPNHSFVATVTLDVTGISVFDANAVPMFYSSVTNSWVPFEGTYNGTSHTFTFTTTHFTPFAFVSKPSTTHDMYIASSAGATASSTITPNSTWRAGSGVTYYGDDDWSWTGSQTISVYLVPEVGSVFQAADVTLQFDKSVMTYSGVEWTGGLSFTSPTATLQTGDSLVRIQAAGSSDFTTTTGQYIAKVNFIVAKPGHSPLSVIKAAFTKSSSAAVFVIPLQAEVKAYIGDVASSGNSSKGDGKIDLTDLSLWSSSYWAGVDGGPGLTNYQVKFDLGPTSSGYVFSLPVPDTKIDFEDLVMFSIGYGLSAQYHLPKMAVPEVPVTVAAGISTGSSVETRIPITISGGVADVRAVSLVLSGQFGKFLGIEKGKLLEPYTSPVMLLSRVDGSSVHVDMAIMGLDANSLNTEGELMVLRFEGSAKVNVMSADCRTSQNTMLGVKSDGSRHGVPTEFGLSQNFPNPFNPSTVLQYQVPAATHVEISIYNIVGAKVATLVNDVKEPGYYNVTWNGTGANGRTVASGVYIYRMHAGDYVSTMRMLLVK
jgi:hypothetical protein